MEEQSTINWKYEQIGCKYLKQDSNDMVEQVSVAVLLDNFLAASNDINRDEADRDYNNMKQKAPVSKNNYAIPRIDTSELHNYCTPLCKINSAYH